VENTAGSFSVGARVREYEILETLSGSGFETIYRARHVLLDEERALKIIHTELANDPNYRDRFVKEAKVFSKLRHPNLVQLFEFGTIDENTFFMVFELIRGESVLQRIKKFAKFTQQDAIKIIREAAQGLHVAHQNRLVHHNLSADSLVLVPTEDAVEITKVIDFGLAKPTKEETTKYRLQDTVQSKLEYSSPETFVTGSGEIDPRSDIYSLGATFYFMVSGHLPFQGTSPKEFIDKHLHEIPEELEHVHPLINRLIMKALSKSRDDRQSSMLEIIQDLNRVPEGGVDQTWNAPTTYTAKPNELEPGIVFARRYLIERKIGQGGMGTVYKATDKILDVAVAVKTINKDITDNERTVKRLKREVILARKVAHPNACRIYDIGETEGVHYVSMEFLEGKSLAEVLQDEGSVKVESGIPILRQLLSALQEAHRVGIFHRDLKPQNIMVDVNGRAFIMDFGISVSEEVNRLTETGMLIGTPRYMAPEQFGNRSVDHRSDIYSMGIIMFEMLTGRLPFDANTPASVMYAHLHGAFMKPTQIVPSLPSNLEAIIMKAMEKDPQNRYQNVSEILRDLVPLEGTVMTALGSILPTVNVPMQLESSVKSVESAPRPAQITSNVLVEEEPTIPGKNIYQKNLGWIAAAAIFLIGLIALSFTFSKKSDHTQKETPPKNEKPATPISTKPIATKPVEKPPVKHETATTTIQTPPAPAPTVPTPAQAFVRTIRLESEPAGAEIFLDGKNTGKKTPGSLSLASNAVGNVQLRLQGYEPTNFTLNDASPDSILKTLKQMLVDGAISLQSPVNFKVYNGKTLLMDTAKTKTFPLKPGPYDISMISVEGELVNYTQKIEVKAGENTALALPPMGFISLQANPSNCKIIVDDNYEDTPPILDLPLSPGKHRIFIEWRSLEIEDEITIDIQNNQKKKLRGFVNDNSYGLVEE
jgi:serine/threonine protein kinase